MRRERLPRRSLQFVSVVVSFFWLHSLVIAEEAVAPAESAHPRSTTTTEESEAADSTDVEGRSSEAVEGPQQESVPAEQELAPAEESTSPDSVSTAPSDEGSDQEQPTSEDLVSIVRSAMVELRTAWSRGVGFLVEDRRTVVYLGALRDRYRRITARLAGSDGAVVRVQSVILATHEETLFTIVQLEEDLPGTPLRLSPSNPGVGDQISLVIRRGFDRRRDRRPVPGRSLGIPEVLEEANAAITTISATTITVGTANSQIWDGSPVFDDIGRVLGFFGRESYAVRAEHIFDPDFHRPGRQLVSPIFGVRIGTEFEGLLDDPFVFEIEAGVAFWDQLGILFRLGFALGNEVLYRIPPSGGRETGVVEGNQNAINLSLELKYRFLLTNAAMPLYVDFVVGGLYTMSILDPDGLTFYSTEPDCDPFVEGCNLAVGPAPNRATDHGVGPVFGFDIRAGLFTMGYRIMARAISYNLPNTHRLTFGVSFR